MAPDGPVDIALEELERLVRQGRSVEDAAGRLIAMSVNRDIVNQAVTIRQRLAEKLQHIAIGDALIDPESTTSAWYTGPDAGDHFWPKLKMSLEADPGWRAAVPALDAASTDIVGLLDAPWSPAIRTRGLVVGHVQSGKTANFTATIAKAADAGYRLFIVLSGVHNALRRQTQLRLDQQLHEQNKTKWLQLTTENRDFGNPVNALPLVASTDLRLLAVVKKNASRLTRLRNWLMQAHREGGLDRCPVLIIDDESDQASPNAARNAELNRTRINRLIGDLLLLPRVAYVGYTATPFANVLINPSDLQDIYPRSFVYSLPKPDSYFGSDELFGAWRSEDEEGADDQPHDMIRVVPDEDAALYRIRRKEPFVPQVTRALGEALRWFVLATAARRDRAGTAKHSSMLIHTTMRVTPQLEYLPVIRERLREMRDEWDTGDINDWRVHWETEARREPAARHGLEPVAFDELASHVPQIFTDVRVVADNSASTERLIYTDEPATVVAVGGNTLSRGLTLEGLISSFFLRSSTAYDSLLQMGRWFGYRPGYGDLPRIWTTSDLAEDFRFLAEVEHDIREDIERYRGGKATPLELPVRIRSHPRMQITAPTKMQFAVSFEASYSGQRPQTTYFNHRDAATIRHNWEAASRLLNDALDAGARPEPEPSRIVLRDVEVDLILNFVSEFSFHQDTDLRGALLERYIRKQTQHGALSRWSIAIITRTGDRSRTLGPFDVALLTRSRLAKSSTAVTANIGTLMSKPDRVADLMPSAEATRLTDQELLTRRDDDGRGLVLLYPIDKNSKPKKSAQDHREALDGIDDLIGVAFAFPSATPGSEPKDMIGVDPVLLGHAQADEMDDEPDAEYVDDEGDHEVDFDGS
jgi:hypothetical protein